MNFVCLALGGNQGPVEELMRQAGHELSKHPQIEQVHCSGVYQTAPVGVHAGDVFRNSAITFHTSLSPENLLDLCQQIEQQSGRKRLIHWGPRTLDLDIIGYGDLILSTTRLNLPHPASWYRRFVLDPLSEIAPNWVHPERQATVTELRNRLLKRPLHFQFQGTMAERVDLVSALRESFPSSELIVSTVHEQQPASAANPTPTWNLIDDLQDQELWCAAHPLNRLCASHWTTIEGQNLIDVVRSSLAAPEKIGEISF